MKLLGYILMTAALLLGSIAVTTSYSPLLDDSLVGLQLNAPAGKVGTTAHPEPIAGPSTTLTAELIAQLRDNDVKRVRVKEFSFARWTHWPHFALSVVIMIAGAMIVRFATRLHIRAQAGEEAPIHLSPSHLISQIDQELGSLRRDLDDILDEKTRLVAIVDRVGVLQTGAIMNFFDARPVLVGTLGLAGFAQVMDRFSAFERTLNRAWSAAADGHEPEAITCLDRAAQIVPEIRDRLGTK